MGMTMSQKVLAAHAGLKEVKAGQLIEAKLDLVLGNDITSPVAINVFEGCQANSVFDNTKVALVMDHFTPNKDIKAAAQCQQVRQFADKYDIKNYFDAIFVELTDQLFQLSSLTVMLRLGSIAGVWGKEVNGIVSPVFQKTLAVYGTGIHVLVELEDRHQLHCVNSQFHQIRNLLL